MNRASKSLSSRGADALSKALKNEKKNRGLDGGETRTKRDSNDSFPPWPLTPPRQHLARSYDSGLVKPFARQVAVLMKVNNQWVLTHPLVNPAANATSSVQVTAAPHFPAEVLKKVQDLEKEGYFFSGLNKDMIVFERVYDEHKRGRLGAYRSTGALLVSVMLLTGALFAVEWIL